MDEYFYSPLLTKRIKEIYDFLPKHHEISVYPEATIKANGMPNGILIKSKAKDSILLPSLIRDPGCGFLLFKIKNVPKKLITPLCEKLLVFIKLFGEQPSNEKETILMSCLQGVSWIKEAAPYFSDARFQVDKNSLYLDIDPDELSKDLRIITNSIELKISHNQFHKECNSELVGFIHTGSDYLPKYISRNWLLNSANQSFENNLSTEEQIKNGCFGMKCGTVEANEYRQVISAAMNYCLYKRWWQFN